LTTAPLSTRRSGSLALVVIAFMVTTVVLTAAFAIGSVTNTVLSGDNDDIMRLMQVRAWLDGQDWFDMTQYRLLPPEGVSMHWSRYVDLGIATILVPLSAIMPMAEAEALMLVIWPTVLLVTLMLLVAKGSWRICGPWAACAAVASVLTWLPTGNLYFEPGRIDHHNVQILATTALAFAMVWPGRAIRRGLLAGLFAAFSLAVGLETLLFVGIAGIILLVRASWKYDGAEALLTAFCLSLAAASVFLFAGQTAPAEWLVPVCDELSPSLLSVIAVACVASLAPMLMRQWSGTVRLLASVTLSAFGLLLIAPLVLPCAAGPYGALPADLRQLIGALITEAQPGLIYVTRQPANYIGFVVPVIGALLPAFLLWRARLRSGTTTPHEGAAVGQMLILGLVGLVGSFVQIRMIILAAPAVPFLTGYVVNAILQKRAQHPTPRWSLALIAAITATLLAPALGRPVQTLLAAAMTAPSGAISLRSQCRNTQVLETLNTLPPARILAEMDLSTSIIMATHHDGLTAPYHRSAASIGNGFSAFDSLATLQQVAISSGAAYVVLCRPMIYPRTLQAIAALKQGDPVTWLRPTPIDSDALLVFAVVPQATDP
jgi:hypothetical protein